MHDLNQIWSVTEYPSLMKSTHVQNRPPLTLVSVFHIGSKFTQTSTMCEMGSGIVG